MSETAGEMVSQQLGDYRVVGFLGAGGMGTVYLAEHIHLRKQYALKILPPMLAGDEGFVARFHDEARVMAELRHPNIVHVHHMGQSQGLYYLVMDYVPGPGGKPLSVQDYLKDQPGGRLPPEKVEKWGAQVADALAYAHKRGVIHRDIKPANILIDNEDNARLADFGLAKAIGNEFILNQVHQSLQSPSRGRDLGLDTMDIAATMSPSGSRVGGMGSAAGTGSSGSSGLLAGAGSQSGSAPRTTSESILGTYDYMAPEQREGGTVDARTDIYATGVLLYRLLTGRRPVGMTRPPSQLVAGLDRKWDTVAGKCLADAPSERYQDAAELRDAIRGGRRALPIPVALPRPAILGVAAGVAIVLIGVVLWAVFGRGGDGESALSRAVQSKSQADTQWEQVATIERGPGIDPLMNEADLTRRQAQGFFEQKAYSQADKAYTDFRALMEKIVAADRERSSAKLAEQTAARAAHTAGLTGGLAENTDPWRKARQAMASAQQAFDAGNFAEARGQWELSERLMNQSVAIAKGKMSDRDAAATARNEAQAAARNAAAVKGQQQDPSSWDQAQSLDAEGQSAWARDDFPAANQLWSRAVEAYKRSESAGKNAIVVSGDAAAARLDAESAASNARAAQAPTMAKDLWTAAEQMRGEAEAHFDKGRYQDSKLAFARAAEQYNLARSRAQLVGRARSAQGDFEKALAEQPLDAEKLKAYGGAAWANVEVEVRRAAGTDDPAAKSAAYGRAIAMLPEATKAAKQTYVAKLLETAEVNATKSGARVALTALNEALRLDPDNPKARQLQTRLAAFMVTDSPSEWLAQAGTEARKVQSVLIRADLLAQLAELQAASGDVTGARATLGDVMPVDRRDGPLAEVAQALALSGQADAAREAAGQIRDMVKQQDALLTVAGLLGAEKVDQLPNPFDRVRADCLAAKVMAQRGKAAEAKALIARASAGLEELGDAYQQTLARCKVVSAQAAAGDIKGAIASAEKIEEAIPRGWAMRDIAEAQAIAGDAKTAIATAGRIEQRLEKATALRLIAEAQAWGGDVRSASSTLSAIGDQQILKQALPAMAGGAAVNGDLDGALNTASALPDSQRRIAYSDIAEGLVRGKQLALLNRYLASLSDPADRAAARLGVVEGLIPRR